MRSAKDSSKRLWTPDPALVRLGAVQALKGIVNLDTVQVAHPRRLTVAEVNALNRMTGGCRCDQSNPPYGSSFVVNGQSLRYHFISKIQNPWRHALEYLQDTQDGPILITQADLACDLYYGDLETLCAPWTLMERYGVCGRLGADTLFWADGSYINSRSVTRGMSIYLKEPDPAGPVLRVELTHRGTKAVKALLWGAAALDHDHVSVGDLTSVKRVGAFWHCLDFRQLNERRAGQRLAGQPIGRTSKSFSRDPVDALRSLKRLALERSRSLADQQFRDDELTTSLLARVLREVAPRSIPRYFDSLNPQLVGIPDQSLLRVGELL
jgi:hypothetical protein